MSMYEKDKTLSGILSGISQGIGSQGNHLADYADRAKTGKYKKELASKTFGDTYKDTTKGNKYNRVDYLKDYFKTLKELSEKKKQAKFSGEVFNSKEEYKKAMEGLKQKYKDIPTQQGTEYGYSTPELERLYSIKVRKDEEENRKKNSKQTVKPPTKKTMTKAQYVNQIIRDRNENYLDKISDDIKKFFPDKLISSKLRSAISTNVLDMNNEQMFNKNTKRADDVDKSIYSTIDAMNDFETDKGIANLMNKVGKKNHKKFMFYVNGTPMNVNPRQFMTTYFSYSPDTEVKSSDADTNILLDKIKNKRDALIYNLANQGISNKDIKFVLDRYNNFLKYKFAKTSAGW